MVKTDTDQYENSIFCTIEYHTLIPIYQNTSQFSSSNLQHLQKHSTVNRRVYSRNHQTQQTVNTLVSQYLCIINNINISLLLHSVLTNKNLLQKIRVHSIFIKNIYVKLKKLLYL